MTDPINATVLVMKIGGKLIDFCVLPCGNLSLDVEIFAMDNSGTVKEHLGSTCGGQWLLLDQALLCRELAQV